MHASGKLLTNRVLTAVTASLLCYVYRSISITLRVCYVFKPNCMSSKCQKPKQSRTRRLCDTLGARNRDLLLCVVACCVCVFVGFYFVRRHRRRRRRHRRHLQFDSSTTTSTNERHQERERQRGRVSLTICVYVCVVTSTNSNSRSGETVTTVYQILTSNSCVPGLT